MTLTVITPTCDRPVGCQILQQYMARQTRQPDQWIIADGGQNPVGMTLINQPGIKEVKYSWKPSPAGARNLCANLLRAIPFVTGDFVAIFEDDDWYSATHLETLVKQLTDEALIVGDPLQRYYNIAERSWRVYDNRGSSLCNTGFHGSILDTFRHIVQQCYDSDLYGVDGNFWKRIPTNRWNLRKTGTVVGVKGLPGQKGLGVGHRPDYKRGWRKDLEFAQLRQWIGEDDTQRYLNMY